MAGYYDIDAILTDAQKVPCTFESTIPGLGYLAGNIGEDIKQGTRLELPTWLGEMLAVHQYSGGPSTVSLDLPDALSTRVLNALKADPLSVDLRAQAQRFYGIAARMLELFDEDDLVEVLTDTFKARAIKVADQAHNSRKVLGGGAQFLNGLESTEQKLFRAAHDGTTNVRKWFESVGNA